MNRGLLLGRRRVRSRFIFFCLILIGLGIYFLKFFMSSPTYKYGAIQYGKITTRHQSNALIIRDEKVFLSPEYGKVVYYVSDGERVNKENLIASIYKPDYQEELLYQLYDTQGKILKYQKDSIIQGIIDNDISKIQQDMYQTLANMQNKVKNNDLRGLDKFDKKLSILMSNSQKAIDKKVTPNDYIAQLYSKEALLNKQLEDWKIDVVAPESGIISFYIDGLNELLDFQSLDTLTIREFNELIEYKAITNDSNQAETEQPFFRLINPLKWYIACDINDRNISFNAGDDVKIGLLQEPNEILDGKIYKCVKEKSDNIVIIELSTCIEEFVNCRNIWIEINKTFEGLIVPKKAIFQQRGRKGVKVLSQNQHKFIGIDIKAEGEDNVIIETISDYENLEILDQILLH